MIVDASIARAEGSFLLLRPLQVPPALAWEPPARVCQVACVADVASWGPEVVYVGGGSKLDGLAPSVWANPLKGSMASLHRTRFTGTGPTSMTCRVICASSPR